MHLWIEDDEDYLLLTHIQTCEFTERKSLVLFSLTRTKDVNPFEVTQRWFDGYPVITKFAKENKCSHIMMNASKMISDKHDLVCKFYEKIGMKKFETCYLKEI